MADRYCDNCAYSICLGGLWVCFNEKSDNYDGGVDAEECCDEWEEAET